jgi:tRNA(Ile)-lysidine synthase
VSEVLERGNGESELSQDLFLQQFLRAVRALKLLGDDSRVLVACSGGLDSTVLAQLLARTRRLLGTEVEMAYVDHNQRGPVGARESAWVKVLAERLAVPFHALDLQAAEGLSQAALRDLRRSALLKLAADRGLNAIATAHHAQDNAETLLMRLMSGVGVSGLSGMAPRDGLWIKPLLWADRSALEDYARTFRLGFVEDPSNGRLKYLRNRVRLELLPTFELLRPGATLQIAQLASRVEAEESEFNAWIEGELDRLEGAQNTLPRSWLERWPTPIERRIVRVWLKRLGIESEPALVEALLSGEDLVHNRGSFLRRSDLLIFTPEEPFGGLWAREPIALELGQKIDLGTSMAWNLLSPNPEVFAPKTMHFNAVFRAPGARRPQQSMLLNWNATPWPLIVRARSNKDDSKTIDRLLAAKKVPRPFWSGWPLLASRQDPKNVVAVLGVHIFEPFALQAAGRAISLECLFDDRLNPASSS